MTPEKRERLAADLSAYLDGELSRRRAEEIEHAIESPNELQRDYEELRAVRDKLRTMPHAAAPREFRSSFADAVTASVLTQRAASGAARDVAQAAGRWERRIAVWSFAGVFATAAMVLLMLYTWGPGLRGPQVPPDESANRDTRDRPGDAREIAATSDGSSRDSRSGAGGSSPRDPAPLEAIHDGTGVGETDSTRYADAATEAPRATIDVTVQARDLEQFEALTRVLAERQRQHSGIEAIFADINGIELSGDAPVARNPSAEPVAQRRPVENPEKTPPIAQPTRLNASPAFAFEMPAMTVSSLLVELERVAPRQLRVKVSGDLALVRELSTRRGAAIDRPPGQSVDAPVSVVPDSPPTPGVNTTTASQTTVESASVVDPTVELIDRLLTEAFAASVTTTMQSATEVTFRVRVLPPVRNPAKGTPPR